MKKASGIGAIVLLLVIAVCSNGFAQTKQPISFEGIIQLPNFGMDDKQIADQIAESGLTFEVTKAQIDSLQKLGFGNLVINAVKQYYRMGILQIATNPALVDIYVDNESQGKTNGGGIWEMELTRGIHNVRLDKNGYSAVDTSITIAKDKTFNLRINLQPTATSPTAYKFFGRYGASVGYGIGIAPPGLKDAGNWKGGNNFILSLKANVLPYMFIDFDMNGANFGKFDAKEGDDFGNLNTFNFLLVPGLYKEFNEKYRGYLGLGLGLFGTKIENGIFEGDGIAYMLDEKGSKSYFGLMAKLGADAFVQENLFLYAEYRGYSVLGKYAMSFIVIGAGVYIN
jgi:opacity protein-like surface antigen